MFADVQTWVPAPAHGPGLRPHTAPAGRRHQDWLTTTVSFTPLHALIIYVVINNVCVIH